MPIIRVEMFKGRTVEQKRKLARDLTEAFVGAAGGNPASVQVLITDVETEDWAQGGALWADKLSDTP